MWNIRTPHTARRARGLTLVEMLMATALSLIMFAAVAQIFGMMGNAMRDARAKIELSGNLRSVANHLQTDLNNLTVDVLPWVKPGSNQGYFEIIEGPDRDVDFAAFDVIGDDPTITTDPHNGSMGGDADDVICFTAYSKDQPFVGLIYGDLVPYTGSNIPHKYWIDQSSGNFTVITSQYAEIVYFTKLTPSDDRNVEEWSTQDYRDANETVTLYRRVFLIRPDIFVGNPNVGGSGTIASYDLKEAEARTYYDLSMSATTSTQWQTNSLEDLQSRERRIGHSVLGSSTTFPFAANPANLLSFEQLNTRIDSLVTSGSTTRPNLRDRTGEDVILTKTLAFDVKVFDPSAVIRQEAAASGGTIAGQPGDFYYPPSGSNTAVYEAYTAGTSMTGAFVDLQWTAGGRATDPLPATSASIFGKQPASGSKLGSQTVGNYSQMPSMLRVPGNNGAGMQDTSLTYAYYDTWPLLYESDGIDQDDGGSGAIDEGTNGFDDNNDGVVDDVGEYETSPPYPVPLRGISVTVRAIEEGTRQIRQDTIMADFLPD